MVKTINNRELLRDYKNLKEKLLKGEISEIRVKQKGGDKVIKITVEKKNPLTELIAFVEKNGPLNIVRPEEDLFDERS